MAQKEKEIQSEEGQLKLPKVCQFSYIYIYTAGFKRTDRTESVIKGRANIRSLYSKQTYSFRLFDDYELKKPAIIIKMPFSVGISRTQWESNVFWSCIWIIIGNGQLISERNWSHRRFLPSYILLRAEILTIFCSYFGRTDNFINSFWNLLTFTSLCCISCTWKRMCVSTIVLWPWDKIFLLESWNVIVSTYLPCNVDYLFKMTFDSLMLFWNWRRSEKLVLLNICRGQLLP